MNVNKVILAGNLTRDPQLRYTPSQTAVCEFGLAVNRKWGSDNEEVCFIDITAWGKQAELIQKYLKKGSQLFVEGRLTLDRWEDRDGKKMSKLKVTLEQFQFVGGKSGGKSPQDDGVQNGGKSPADDTIQF